MQPVAARTIEEGSEYLYGRVRAALLYLQELQVWLGHPPELGVLFPPEYTVDFGAARVRQTVREWTAAEAWQREQAALAGLGGDGGAGVWTHLLGRAGDARGSREEPARAVAKRWEDVPRGLSSAGAGQRLIVLGHPGYGKSWLLRHEGRVRCEEQLAAVQQSGTRAMLPVFARFWDLKAASGDFATRIAHAVRWTVEGFVLEEVAPGKRPAMRERLVRLVIEQVQLGRAVLLLDGLDEVAPDDPVRDALETYAIAHAATAMVVTSRIVGYRRLNLRAPGSAGPAEWDLEVLGPREVEAYIQWYLGERPDALNNLRTRLRTDTWLRNLVQVPLMAAVVCKTVWGNGAVAQRRAELYQQCVEGLLTWRRVGVDELQRAEAVDAAARLALALLREGTLAQGAPMMELRTHLEEAGLAEPKATELLRVLHAAGLLIREREGMQEPSRFLHLSFGEYLAAVALAQEDPAKRDNEVRQHLWFEPLWEEVVVFLAGVLALPRRPRGVQGTPQELLAVVQQEPDDLFGSMDQLACRVAAEGEEQAAVRALSEQMLGRWECAGDGFWRWRATDSLRILAVHDRRSLDGLRDRCMHDEDPGVREAAARALGECRAGDAVTLEVLRARCVHDEDSEVRRAAVTALRRCGAADAPTLEFLRARCAHDQDWEVRRVVAWGLGQCGPGDAATLEVLRTRCVHDEDWMVRSFAAEALGQCGAGDATTLEFLRARCVHDEDRHVRGAAARALGECGVGDAVTLEVLRARCVHDEDSRVRREAAWALRQCGAGDAVTVEFLRARCACNEDREVRWVAARVLGECGAGDAATLEVLRERCMHDEDSGVREAAARALGQCGAGDATTLEVLRTRCVHDEDWAVRLRAAEALGECGVGDAATLEVLRVCCVHDEDPLVRSVAARVLGQCGAGDATTLEVLRARCAHDKDSNMRGTAAWALGECGAGDAATLEVLRARCVHDEDAGVLHAAAKALWTLSCTTRTPIRATGFRTPDGRPSQLELELTRFRGRFRT